MGFLLRWSCAFPRLRDVRESGRDLDISQHISHDTRGARGILTDEGLSTRGFILLTLIPSTGETLLDLFLSRFAAPLFR